MPLKKATTLLNTEDTTPVQSVAEKATEIKKAFDAPKADKPMTRSDWDSKDRRISRQGLFQAALQSPALMQYAPTLEDYIALVVRTADAGLAYVNE